MLCKVLYKNNNPKGCCFFVGVCWTIVFIVVFLSIGLSGRSRKNVLLLSLTASISAAVLFYVTQMLTMILAKFGYITPFAGAWFPVILFIFISIALLRTART